jgi:hypothetical protein
MFLINKQVDFASSELMKYSVVGLFCGLFLIAIVVLITWFKKWIEEQNQLKEERIKKLEEMMEFYQKNDRHEMLILIERSNQIHERNERLWEEVKNLLIQFKNR